MTPAILVPSLSFAGTLVLTLQSDHVLIAAMHLSVFRITCASSYHAF